MSTAVDMPHKGGLLDVKAKAGKKGVLDQPQPIHGTMRFCSDTTGGIKDRSVRQSTGNNTNTHISTSKILFLGHFRGFVTLSCVSVELIAPDSANTFYCAPFFFFVF